MDKSLLIIVLAVLQSACATPASNTGSGRDLLTFKQIASEISVQYEELDADTDLSRTTAWNVPPTR